MKTSTFKALMILVGSMLLNIQSMHAGIGDKFKHFVDNELIHFHLQGLLVIGGVIVASLVFYFINNRFNKDKDSNVRGHNKINPHNHHRRHHHQRVVIKKTS